MPFEKVCRCFEALGEPTAKGVGARNIKSEMLHKLWAEFGIREHPLFELMRLTLPHLDTVRPQYRLKQKGIARMYVEILALVETSDDAHGGPLTLWLQLEAIDGAGGVHPLGVVAMRVSALADALRDGLVMRGWHIRNASRLPVVLFEDPGGRDSAALAAWLRAVARPHASPPSQEGAVPSAATDSSS